MRTAKDVKKEIVRQYDKNPKDWRLHVGRDVRGHYDLAVAHGSTAWIIKEEQINPFKFVGFGAKTSRQNLEPLIEDIPNIFGIRSVSEKRMSELANALERKESVKDILAKIMKSNPVKSHEIKGPMVFQGPISYSAKPIHSISEGQRRLDSKLRIELENLLNRKHPQVLRPYI
jgi:hypothetical protein